MIRSARVFTWLSIAAAICLSINTVRIHASQASTHVPHVMIDRQPDGTKVALYLRGGRSPSRDRRRRLADSRRFATRVGEGL